MELRINLFGPASFSGTRLTLVAVAEAAMSFTPSGKADAYFTAIHIQAIEHFNSFLGLEGSTHDDKRVAFGLMSQTIFNEIYRNHSSRLSEKIRQHIFRGAR